MRVAVIGHHSRQERAENLADTLGATLFLDTGDHGPTWNHLRALEWADGERILILEDDALPVPDFQARAQAWITRFPDDLLSLYLGTGHPRQWMRRVDEQWDNGHDHVTLTTLIHAVCYTIPPTPGLHTNVDPARPIDFALGDAWRTLTGRDVIYPKRSLVQHDDIPSINSHPRQPRRARQLLA